MPLDTTLRRPTPLPLKAVPRLLRTARHDMVPALNVLFEATGSPARMHVPGVVDLVLVDRPQDVEQIFLRKQDVYVKGEEYDVPALGLRRGLVTSRGERWKRDRAMLNPMFARRHLEAFTDSMVNQANSMLDGWAAHPDGARIDVAHDMMVVALQIAAETMFGTHLSDAEVATVGEGLTQALEDMLRVGNSPVTWLLQALPGVDMASAASAHWRSRRIASRLRELDAMITKRIEQRAADSNDRPTDFLGLVLAAQDQATGQHLSRAEVLEQSATFLAAGHETTATAMAWFWHLLSQNPDARTRMLDEVDTVLQGRPPAYDDFDRLPWTKACFSEAMRMHPPVYLSMRRATADDDLNGYRITRGTIVVVLTHRLHRNPDFWPDPERFDPTRFLPGTAVERPKAAYAPFGGGRRICIGSQFAMLEATMIAARTSQRFVLDAAPGHRVVEEGFTTLAPQRRSAHGDSATHMKERVQVSGRTAVISGAASGIGRALAVRLAAHGCALALSDWDEAGLKETAALVDTPVMCRVLDVRDRDAQLRWADDVVGWAPTHLGIVVNNAGVVLTQWAAQADYDDDKWLMDINFWGVAHGTRAFLPHLINQGSGVVVNMSSIFGLCAFPSQSAYCAAKFAVRGYTEAVRQELHGTGVRAATVHPGGVRTPITRSGRIRVDPLGDPDLEKFHHNFSALALTSPEQAAETIHRGVTRGQVADHGRARLAVDLPRRDADADPLRRRHAPGRSPGALCAAAATALA